MKKFFNSLAGILSVITAGMGIYYFVWDHNVMGTAVAFFECIFLTILFIMSESRPRETEAQRKQDDKIQSQGLGILMICFIAIVLVVFLASCTTSGYGCHGRSKYITGYAPDKWERKYHKGN